MHDFQFGVPGVPLFDLQLMPLHHARPLRKATEITLLEFMKEKKDLLPKLNSEVCSVIDKIDVFHSVILNYVNDGAQKNEICFFLNMSECEQLRIKKCN